MYQCTLFLYQINSGPFLQLCFVMSHNKPFRKGIHLTIILLKKLQILPIGEFQYSDIDFKKSADRIVTYWHRVLDVSKFIDLLINDHITNKRSLKENTFFIMLVYIFYKMFKNLCKYRKNDLTISSLTF